MKKNIKIYTYVFLTFFLYCCGDDTCPAINEDHLFIGINQGEVNMSERCGFEIRIIDGFEEINLLSDSESGDSLFYTSSLPVETLDTFIFKARKATSEEFYSCNPLSISGYRQIIIEKIISIVFFCIGARVV